MTPTLAALTGFIAWTLLVARRRAINPPVRGR